MYYNISIPYIHSMQSQQYYIHRHGLTGTCSMRKNNAFKQIVYKVFGGFPINK